MHFGFIIKIAALALLRSWRPTVVLALMVFFAVVSLIFVSALAVGTNDAMIRNSTGLFTGHIAGKNIVEPIAELQQLEGVRQLLQRKHMVAMLSHDAIVETVNLIGIDPELEQRTTALYRKTISGVFPVSDGHSLYLSSDMANRLQVNVGDKLVVNSQDGTFVTDLTVVGIYRTGLSRLDYAVAFCPVAAIEVGWQQISAAVFLERESELNLVAEQLQQLQPSAQFTTWPEFMPDLKQLIDLDNICMAIVIILVFGIVAVGISCMFLIFTLKNMREHGIMKAMGLQSANTVLLLVVQIGLLTLTAAVAGTLAGFLLVTVFSHIGIDISRFTSHNQYFAVSGVLYPRLTMQALLAPPIVATIFGLLAAIWPISYVICKDPAEILRSV
jgi:ABC-type lipoprotein release transport system permease subunit